MLLDVEELLLSESCANTPSTAYPLRVSGVGGSGADPSSWSHGEFSSFWK